MEADIHGCSHHISPGQNPDEGHHSPDICICIESVDKTNKTITVKRRLFGEPLMVYEVGNNIWLAFPACRQGCGYLDAEHLSNNGPDGTAFDNYKYKDFNNIWPELDEVSHVNEYKWLDKPRFNDNLRYILQTGDCETPDYKAYFPTNENGEPDYWNGVRFWWKVNAGGSCEGGVDSFQP